MPLMSTGATDSAQLRLHNVQAYGLLPFPLTEASTVPHSCPPMTSGSHSIRSAKVSKKKKDL